MSSREGYAVNVGELGEHSARETMPTPLHWVTSQSSHQWTFHLKCYTSIPAGRGQS
jgi:hypothetical protein